MLKIARQSKTDFVQSHVKTGIADLWKMAVGTQKEVAKHHRDKSRNACALKRVQENEHFTRIQCSSGAITTSQPLLVPLPTRCYWECGEKRDRNAIEALLGAACRGEETHTKRWGWGSCSAFIWSPLKAWVEARAYFHPPPSYAWYVELSLDDESLDWMETQHSKCATRRVLTLDFLNRL